MRGRRKAGHRSPQNQVSGYRSPPKLAALRSQAEVWDGWSQWVVPPGLQFLLWFSPALKRGAKVACPSGTRVLHHCSRFVPECRGPSLRAARFAYSAPLRMTGPVVMTELS